MEASMARPQLTAREVKRIIGVLRVVAPIVTPFAMRAAGYARHRWDLTRARRLGVPVEQLPSFTGRGAALHARLAGLAAALSELAQRNPDDVEITQYVQRTERRLADLAAAVRIAERMAPARRKAAHQAVARELNELENKLLARLGFFNQHGFDQHGFDRLGDA
jgi:Family of unknown function (DUF6474)